ncbi:MAG: hypothetical protein SNJ52_00600 [Verrucomicrobiia bacterium]
MASEVSAMLRKAFGSGRLAHAYLISGSDQSGLTEVAGELVASLMGHTRAVWPPPSHPDLHLIAPESRSRKIVIEQIRELERLIRLRPALAVRKVGVVLEADRLQPQAANAFLKTLEEPPPDSLLLLTSNNSEAVLGTILSRCIRIPLRAPNNQTDPDPHRVAELMDQSFQHATLDLATILRAVRLVEARLQTIRAGFTTEAEAALKLFKKELPDGIASEVVKDREEQLKAAAEASYLRERDRVLDGIASWWLEMARSTTDSRASHPVSRMLGTKGILRFLETIETMRDQLGRNVPETLVLEAGFLSLHQVALSSKRPAS